MSDDRDLTAQEQQELLKVARETITSLTGKGSLPRHDPGEEGLSFQRGAFVTLHKQGQLRGCIGNFFSEDPLVRTVEEMAICAASQDPRFPPVGPQEVDELDVEISVLSPLREIEDVTEIQVGVHGIYMVNPLGRGVLLPQVATEQGWDRDTFLEHTCLKAGLGPGCWQDPNTKVMVFTAQIFGEKDNL